MSKRSEAQNRAPPKVGTYRGRGEPVVQPAVPHGKEGGGLYDEAHHLAGGGCSAYSGVAGGCRPGFRAEVLSMTLAAIASILVSVVVLAILSTRVSEIASLGNRGGTVVFWLLLSAIWLGAVFVMGLI